ncbi:MAG: hypothetical protein CMK46_00890 [Porticoccus sp.]|nr:hypothetical protein [Porticoccus sp.]|tara:strand:+ start:2072 stop:2455 length:384 start_codon:yes stop_codon:yes gene_type:complete
MNTRDHLSDFLNLYKFYWEVAIKLCIFFVGSAGAVSAYVIKNQNVAYMGLALVIPIVMCIFGSWLAYTRIPGLKFMRDEVERLSKELGQESYLELGSLVIFTKALGALLLLCALGMIILLGYFQCNS